MKKHSSLTFRQTLFAGAILLLFAGGVLFLGNLRGEERRFEKLTEELFHEEMLSGTLNMHYTLAHPENFGIDAYEATLSCYDAEAQAQGRKTAEDLWRTLEGMDPDRLSTESRYTYSLLSRSLENSLRLGDYPYYAEPLSPHSGMQSQLPILLAEYTFRSRRDVEDYLKLLDQTDEYFASLLTFEQEKADAGFLMAASSLKKVIRQCDTILTKDSLSSGEHFLQTTFHNRLQPLLETGEITKEDAAKYIAANDRLLRTVLRPAYETLADGLFLLEDAASPLEGLAARPGGEEYYQSLLRSETGSYREIADIKRLLSEAFHQEYTAIHTLLAAHPETAIYLQNGTGDSFPLETPEQMLADLQMRMAEDFPALKEPLPNVAVKEISESLQEYCAPAFYLTAPLDDTDNNVIYINPRQSPQGAELYTTLAHEGYPGHLYQTVYCNRLFAARGENLIRQALWYGGYQEGWALYVEFLSYDYAVQLLQEGGREEEALCLELEKHNRSLQLCLYSLLDIMIHDENASPEQTAKVLEAFGIDDAAAITAVYTYIAEEPCNYLKYYLGYLEFTELQKEAALLWQGDYSDLRFHTFILDCGSSDFGTLREELYRQAPSSLPDSPDPTAGS